MAMELRGRAPSAEEGETFFVLLRHWPAFHGAIVDLCSDLFDSATLHSMQFNSHAGPMDQDTCTTMANRIEAAMDTEVGFQAAQRQLDTVTEDGIDKIEDEHERECLYVYLRMRRWLAFLRHCGGFEVW